MAASESQPPNESTRPRGAGGDIQSKGLPMTDAEGADSREDAEGGAQAEASGGAAEEE